MNRTAHHLKEELRASEFGNVTIGVRLANGRSTHYAKSGTIDPADAGMPGVPTVEMTVTHSEYLDLRAHGAVEETPGA